MEQKITEKELDAIIEWYDKMQGKFAYYIGDGNVRNNRPLMKNKY